ncbi:MAG TPA: ATP-dependent Clp protease proteolytic subunit, partial [Kineosporiaceae bacterium]|nr:ATP-dependent Clp protease proteolytic subunit [Kineosporiaceae bacterium]
DIKIQAELILHMKKQMAQLIAEQTGQPLETIERDSDRDRWFTADQALEYGLVDHVVTNASDVRGGGGTTSS